jgi:hypothetical protein
MRPSYPRRLKFWPVGDNQQHAKGPYSVHRATDRFQARGVDPMCILEHHQHWIAARQRLKLRSQRF